MRPQFNNHIPCCVIRKDSTGKSQVLSIVGLPADRDYELYHQQPNEGNVDEDLVYLTSRKMLWAIKSDNLKDLRRTGPTGD